MSGGVDSSVAAHLLVKEGVSFIAVEHVFGNRSLGVVKEGMCLFLHFTSLYSLILILLVCNSDYCSIVASITGCLA